MEIEQKKATLKTVIAQMEQKRLIGEIDERVWLGESMMKANTQNTANHQQVKSMNALLDKQITKAKEMLDELEK